MESMMTKLKSLYQQYDMLEAAGEDVVADLRKEINNLELSYLKEEVFPQVAAFMGSMIRELRCGIDSSFQSDAKSELSYSFCTSEVMLLVKDSLKFEQIAEGGTENRKEEMNNDVVSESSPRYDVNHIRIVDYSEKAIAVYGDSRAFIDQFKSIGGYFNAHLKEGAGWVFSKKRRQDVCDVLGTGLKDRDVNDGETINSVGEVSDQKGKATETKELKNSKSHEEWIAKLTSMRGRTNKGYPSPHKQIFILTIIEGIKQGIVTSEVIYPLIRLAELFKKIWNKYVPVDWPYAANFYQPFIHMGGEDFYALNNVIGVKNFDVNQSWTKSLVRRYVISGRFNKRLFRLLSDDKFTAKLIPAITKIFTEDHKNVSDGSKISEDDALKGINDFKHDLSIKQKFDLTGLGFKRFLSTIKTSSGVNYPTRMIDQYVAILDSTYMFKIILKYHQKGNIYEIRDVATLTSILEEVKKDFGVSTTNGTYLAAMELYIRFFNLVKNQEAQEQVYLSPRRKKTTQLPYGAKVKQILGNDFIINGAGNSAQILYEFVENVGVERVYELKIPFLRGYLVDRTRNQTYLSNCKYFHGGYWLNTAGSLGKKIELIQYIADMLKIKIKIEIEKK